MQDDSVTMDKDTTKIESSYKICSKCIYDERVPSISFDHLGVCNYCKQVEKLVEEYGTGTPKGKQIFEKIVNEIKKLSMYMLSLVSVD